jgi:hypothetical protein
MGNYMTGTAADNSQHLFLGSPVAWYAYADVHDPRDPPNPP